MSVSSPPSNDRREFSTYASRRVFPTIADLLNMGAAERNAVGAWNTAEATIFRQEAAMPILYSDEKVQTSLVARDKLYVVVRAACDFLEVSIETGNRE